MQCSAIRGITGVRSQFSLIFLAKNYSKNISENWDLTPPGRSIACQLVSAVNYVLILFTKLPFYGGF